LIHVNLRLALRERIAVFMNYVFPLIFLVVFGMLMHVERGGLTVPVVTMVLVIAMLGNGLFGGGLRTVQDREQNILRRFRVAPISPAPLLVASMATGLILFLPALVLVVVLAHILYGLPWPAQWASLLILSALGVVAFRAIGLIIASVANSSQESQILVQLVYLPMLLLSGTTLSITMLPSWLQAVSQLLPATYLVIAFDAMLLRGESLAQNWPAVGVLVFTTAAATILAAQLFRWEKDEKLRPSAKLSLASILIPSLIFGGYQLHNNGQIAKTKSLHRGMLRNQTLLIRGARIFIGDGRVIEMGAVLVRGGRIAEVYDGAGPDPKTLSAEVIEASGKTVLPGLIDVQVNLASPGGVLATPRRYAPRGQMERALAAYLYSGITAVRSAGDPFRLSLAIRAAIAQGQRLGAELFVYGPPFTAPGGHGTEYTANLPEFQRRQIEPELVRLPATAEQARVQVDELQTAPVDGIEAILDSGGARPVPRMDSDVFEAVAQEAHKDGLPLAVHTGDSRDVAEALDAGADSIEHGSYRDAIPAASFARMARQRAAYDPTLSVVEGYRDFAEGNAALLERSLVEQVGPPDLLKGTRLALSSPRFATLRAGIKSYPLDFNLAKRNLIEAYRAGVMLVTGSDAGNFLVIHGPTVQRELELWVAAGIPPAVALEAATYNAARLLHADRRMGSIRKGLEADLLIVDGNPLADIAAAGNISAVIFKGEHVERTLLFHQE
jgi:imidazolonepropionase-like amidohydrolase/ABC-type multidrug transport system permease subunit